MSTIVSTRMDDSLKEASEALSEELGLTLSAVITVFLKRFVAEGGFPFDVKRVPKKVSDMQTNDIVSIVKQAVKSTDTCNDLPPVTYFDPETNTLVSK